MLYLSKYKSKSAQGDSVLKNIYPNYLNAVLIVMELFSSRTKTVRTDDLINPIENVHLGDPNILIRKIAN